MATGNITTTEAAPFIPEIWAQSSIGILRSVAVAPRLVTRDFDTGDFRSQGDILHNIYPGTLASAPKAAGSDVTKQKPTGEENRDLTLDKYQEVTIVLEDHSRAFANQDLANAYATSAIEPLVNDVEDEILGLYSGLTYSAGTGGIDLTDGTMLDGRKTMNDNKAPSMARAAIISTKDAKGLLGDSKLERYFDVTNPEAIRNGRIGRLRGFETYESDRVISSGGTTYNLGFDRGAFILGSRPLPPPPAGVGATSSEIVDPESGLVISVVMTYSGDALGVQITHRILFGADELFDEKAIQLLG